MQHLAGPGRLIAWAVSCLSGPWWNYPLGPSEKLSSPCKFKEERAEVIPSSCKFPTSLSCLKPNDQMQQKEILKSCKKLQMALTFFTQVSSLSFITSDLWHKVYINEGAKGKKREHHQVSRSSQTGLKTIRLTRSQLRRPSTKYFIGSCLCCGHAHMHHGGH